MDPINVLVTLHRGYGLGDAVQMSAVLRHVAKHRPHWRVDLQAEEGRHQVGLGLVERHFAFGANPRADVRYDAEVLILLYDTWAGWADRPNTRVSSCLRERFGLDWDPECARYRVDVRPESAEAASAALYGALGRKDHRRLVQPKRGKRRCVAVHYQGDSAAHLKDLAHWQANAICEAIERLGRVPVVLDWRARCPLDRRRLRSPEGWGTDAEMVTAVIAECEAFVGIDSGPSKCASATDTPSLIAWTLHHPAPFHDPAPNTTHLVPTGFHDFNPVRGDPSVVEWFDAHYHVRQYSTDLVREVETWLKETLPSA
jgi:hypothetical protein